MRFTLLLFVQAACLLARASAFFDGTSGCVGCDLASGINKVQVVDPFNTVTVEKTTSSESKKTSSHSHTKSSSSKRENSESKEWSSSVSNTGGRLVRKTEASLDRKNSGSDAASESERRAASNLNKQSTKVVVDGKVYTANEKGSSQSSSSSSSSSESNSFSDAISKAIKTTQIVEQRTLNCIKQRNINIFLVVHIDASALENLRFIRRLIMATYFQNHVNFYCSFFPSNLAWKTFSTLGRNSLTNKIQLVNQLNRIEEYLTTMSSSQFSSAFQINSALDSCYAFAKTNIIGQLKQRPSILLTFFNKNLNLNLQIYQGLARFFKRITKKNPFAARLCVTPRISGHSVEGGLENLTYLKKITNLLASAPEYAFTDRNEKLVNQVLAKVITRGCTAKYI